MENLNEETSRRTVLNSIKSHLNNVHKKAQRAKFLYKCIENKVCPRTLALKPPQNGASKSKNTQTKFQTAAFNASQKMLSIAHSDACKEAKEERIKYSISLSEKLTNLSDKDKNQINSLIKTQEPQIIKKWGNKFRQKLHFLIKKTTEKQQDTSEVPGIQNPKKQTRTRRFVKRNKFKRWKQQEARKQINLVKNLSDYPMTNDMFSLLNRGLSFVITPSYANKTEVKADIQSYQRTLRWKEFHYGESLSEDSDTEQENSPKSYLKAKKKSNLPPGPPPPALDTYIKAVESDVMGSIGKLTKPNVPDGEIKALKQLQEAQEEGKIRIAAVDKGGGVAVLQTQDYIHEMKQEHLDMMHTDEAGEQHPYYVSASMSEVKVLQEAIKTELDKALDLKYISKSDHKAMQPSEKVGRLYGQPKVHKAIPDGKKLPPMRPIISASGSITENISHFVDTVTKNEVKKLESYVEDTPHMLRIFEEENKKGPQEDGAFPVSIDVVGLYSNIPCDGDDGGMQAFEEMLENREDKTIPTCFLMTLLALVLKGNIFQFCQKLYRQVIGTAMGTRLAPNYAINFMGSLERKKLLGQWTGTQPKLYKRFIDDLFFIWSSSEQELLQFLDHLNSRHKHIKFTISYDIKTRSVPFLDMIVSIDNNGKIVTDLFKKPTAVCQFLQPNSCHPGHVTRNIPYSLSYRLLRICSNREMFLTRLEELRTDLIARGYRPKIIQDAFERAKQVPREVALQKVQSKTSAREAFVTTYHPALPSLSNIVRKHHRVMVESDPQMERCFPKPSLICYKRHKNIKDHLIRAKVSTKKSSKRRPNGFKPCSSLCKMCALCPTASTRQPVTKHKCYRTGKEWNITSPMDCNTMNCIYKIICKRDRCKDFVYIGETQREVKKRLYDHVSYVNNKRLETPAGQHFNLPGHNVADMALIPIERVRPANNPFVRKVRESLWIRRYDSINFGENKKR